METTTKNKAKISKKELGMLIAVAAIITAVIFSGCIEEEKPTEKQGKTVTIIDDAGRTVTIHTPIKSFVYHGHNSYVYETLRALGVRDRIIGATDRFVTPGKWRYSEAYFPELVNFTDVGLLKSPDYELINTLKPDVVFTDEERCYDADKTPGIPVIALDVKPTTFKENTMKYGYLFNKEKEAKEYIDWYNKWENVIKNRTKDIPEDKKPLVYIGYYNAVKYGSKTFQLPARDNYRNVIVRMAGGRGMGDEINGSGILKVDAEWVIKRNPDVIIFSASNKHVGYDITNSSKVAALRDAFLKRPEFAEVNAVKNKRVYIISHSYLLCGGASGLIASMYIAKWSYPDRFADIDPQVMHQEFVTKFQHLDLNVSHTVCVYPTK